MQAEACSFSCVRKLAAIFIVILTMASALNNDESLTRFWITHPPCFMAVSHLQWTCLSFKHGSRFSCIPGL